MDDRRRSARHSINAEFQSIEQFLSEYTTDISLTGCFIRSQKPLPKGTLVELCFTVLDSDLAIIEGQGEITRIAPDGMGVRFTHLTDASRDHIERFLANKAES